MLPSGETYCFGSGNRYVACLKANVEPRTVEWGNVYAGPMSIYEWVASINSQRRHLKTDQIIMIHVDLREMVIREEGRQRQIGALGRTGEPGDDNRPDESAPVPMDSSARETEPKPASRRRNRSGETRAKLAREVGVSQHKIQQALTVKKADPILAAEVREGKKSLAKAIKELEDREDDGVQPIDVPRVAVKLMAHIDGALTKASGADQKAVVTRLIEMFTERQ